MTNKIISGVIRKCYEDLKIDLPFPFVSDGLWSQGVFSIDEKTEIEARSSIISKNKLLLDTLLKKNDEDLDILISILNGDRAHRRLVRILEESKLSVVAENRSPGSNQSNGQDNPQPPPNNLVNPQKTPDNLANMGDRSMTNRSQLVAIAKIISEDGDALRNIPGMCDSFLTSAADRMQIFEMGIRQEPIIERIKQMLEIYRSKSSPSPTLKNISDSLKKSDLPNLAAKILVMKLPEN